MAHPLSIATDGYLGAEGSLLSIATQGHIHADVVVQGPRVLYRHLTGAVAQRSAESLSLARSGAIMIGARASETLDRGRLSGRLIVIQRTSQSMTSGRLSKDALARRIQEILDGSARGATTTGFGTAGYQIDVIFPRGNFTSMLVTIKSNEELGILDSGYVEDYFGVDGYMTIRRASDNFRTSIPMSPVPEETPGVLNDVFRGVIDLTTTANGVYFLEGRVRDLMGNYTIFGAVQTPLGGENISTLTLQIVDGFAAQYVHKTPAVNVRAGVAVGEVARLGRQIAQTRSGETIDLTRRFVEIVNE